MTALPTQDLPAGQAAFARYAYPPNELGYCGPADSADSPAGVATHAREFDGAWPYLRIIADAANADPLDPEVVRSYWVGGPLLTRVAPDVVLDALRRTFAGQVTGLLDDLAAPVGVLPHHSFHVFVVYPWVGFLDRDAVTALRVLQDCRIRWGTVTTVEGEHAVIDSRPLTFHDGILRLGDPAPQRVRWSKAGASLIAAPAIGATVSAHWDWVCDTLTETDCLALSGATQTTLDLVNAARRRKGVRR